MYSRPASLTAPEHISDVLPTVAPDLDYGALGEVQEGLAAGRAYLEMINPKTDDERRNALITSLNEYCKLDTLAMVRLARFLQQQTRNVVEITSFT